MTGRRRGHAGVVGPEAGNVLLLGAQRDGDAIALRRFRVERRGAVLRIAGWLPRIAELAGREGERTVASPVGLESRTQSGRRRHPQARTGWRRIRRSVVPKAFVAAVRRRPREDV